jgi:hypothetical protein
MKPRTKKIFKIIKTILIVGMILCGVMIIYYTGWIVGYLTAVW